MPGMVVGGRTLASHLCVNSTVFGLPNFKKESLSVVCGLGLQKYEKNIRKGQLTDATVMLWNDR